MSGYEDVLSTSLRYQRPSFLRGFASSLDLFGTLRAESTLMQGLSPAEQDQLAIAEDWLVVGEDLRRAMERFAAR